ncbi:MAG: carboxypeptidase regulatory-like domain-containing protein [Nitrospira sp.]|nr:carboxypeptidase regulatory-like domain-containing protein [Nitrospira sp.]MBX3370292.1 carboxypeptidase regulatory-like domain-containing protein [Nitrospira sp.]
MLEESASNLGRVRVEEASRKQALGEMFVRPKTSPARIERMRGRREISKNTARHVVFVWGLIATFCVPSVLFASHAADHRFTVEGFVCGKDGRPAVNVEVLVKDTRITVGQTVTTDGDGYYKVTLHLHNDNVGDPLLVEAAGEQKNSKIQFDPNDLETERKLRIDFGSGCERDLGPPQWLLYGLGIAAVAIVGWIGLKISRKRMREEQRRKKGQGKRQK